MQNPVDVDSKSVSVSRYPIMNSFVRYSNISHSIAILYEMIIETKLYPTIDMTIIESVIPTKK